MCKDASKEAIINYIVAMDNTEDNSQNFEIAIITKNTIIATLVIGFLPMVGIVARKEMLIATICCCVLMIICIFSYFLGRWLNSQLIDNKSAILIYRISIGVGMVLSWSISLLYAIILITGDKDNAVIPMIVVVIMTFITIPLGIVRANYVIKKNRGLEPKSKIKSPPVWFAVIIASFLSRLTYDGITFSITLLLCIINIYFFCSTMMPNVVRLYLVKKYGLEDEIPLIFNSESREH